MIDPIFWQAWDAAESSAVPATLAGLSISSASLLFNFSKEAAVKLKPFQDNVSAAERALQNAQDNEKTIREANLRLEKKAAKPYKNIVDDINAAIKALLLAFWAFILDLSWSLSIDPMIDETAKDKIEFFQEAISQGGITYNDLIPVDVLASGATLSFGVYFLCRAARKMQKSVPLIIATVSSPAPE